MQAQAKPFDNTGLRAGTGLLTGFTNAVAGVGGPPLTAYALISRWDPRPFAATIQPLFIVIGVAELTRTGQEIMAANFRAVEIWTAVGVLYLIMTGILSITLRIIEKRMRIL